MERSWERRLAAMRSPVGTPTHIAHICSRAHWDEMNVYGSEILVAVHRVRRATGVDGGLRIAKCCGIHLG